DTVFLYTGGTTGLPKGVMWTHADLFKQFSAGYMAMGGEVPTSVEGVGRAARTMREMGVAGPQIAAPPLMHGMAWFTSMSRLMTGGTVVTLTNRSFGGRGPPGAAPLLRHARALALLRGAPGHQVCHRRRRLRAADDPCARGGRGAW